VTAPTRSRLEAGSDTRNQVRDPMSDADANNRAVERVISLLNEIVEKRALPALGVNAVRHGTPGWRVHARFATPGPPNTLLVAAHAFKMGS
jgi:hypothetical protein